MWHYVAQTARLSLNGFKRNLSISSRFPSEEVREYRLVVRPVGPFGTRLIGMLTPVIGAIRRTYLNRQSARCTWRRSGASS
jgi:hypothetical protein